MISAGATASVGDTIAPSTKDSAQPRPTTSWATTATAAIVTNTRGMASAAIAVTFRRSSRDRGEEGGAVQQRRQEDQQHDVRVELHGRHAGQEADHRAAEHERDRVGNAQQAREHGERGCGHQEAEDEQLDVVHAKRVAASSAMAVVTLYGKPGCHLCDDARAIVERVRAQRPFELEEVDVSLDPTLHREYGQRIPVLALDGVELFEFHVEEAALLQQLDRVDGS